MDRVDLKRSSTQCSKPVVHLRGGACPAPFTHDSALTLEQLNLSVYHAFEAIIGILMCANEIGWYFVSLTKGDKIRDPFASGGRWSTDTQRRIDLLDCLRCAAVEFEVIALRTCPE